jgi:hypothetical protein
MAAEAEAGNIKDWMSLYQSYQHFSNCDDGAIAEGYSYSISRLLVEEWKSIDSLDKLVCKDKDFEQFVLHHIDSTIPQHALQTIVENARLSCPSQLTYFCELVITRVASVRSGIVLERK